MSSESPESGEFSASHSYLRSLIATRYLLGSRQGALTESLAVNDEQTRAILERCKQKLSLGEREDRARYLARQVTRLIRSLRAQRLR